MSGVLRHLRLAAVNADGVLLTDTFSPLIHQFVVSRGGTYSAEVERRIFSQRREVAGQAMADAVPQSMTGEQALRHYFAERAAYLAEHPVEVAPGAAALLHRLRTAGLRTVCYGGLAKAHFDRHLGWYTGFFDDPVYICTNDFRPGIREIAERFSVPPSQTLFIDDVARVAEEARGLGVPFIGRPSSFVHCHQAELMRQAGVRHVVDSLAEIDPALLRTVDREAAAGTLWDSGGASRAVATATP